MGLMIHTLVYAIFTVLMNIESNAILLQIFQYYVHIQR